MQKYYHCMIAIDNYVKLKGRDHFNVILCQGLYNVTVHGLFYLRFKIVFYSESNHWIVNVTNISLKYDQDLTKFMVKCYPKSIGSNVSHVDYDLTNRKFSEYWVLILLDFLRFSNIQGFNFKLITIISLKLISMRLWVFQENGFCLSLLSFHDQIHIGICT